MLSLYDSGISRNAPHSSFWGFSLRIRLVEPLVHALADPHARLCLARPCGQWRDDDYDVLENGIVAGCGVPRSAAVSAMDVGERAQWRDQSCHARLCGDARGCDGGLRELAPLTAATAAHPARTPRRPPPPS